MSESLYPQERRQEILQLLAEENRVSVTELSQRFKVSEVTIRGDLQELAEQGLLIRTHGGALATTSLPELSFNLRKQQQMEAKQRIGQEAARLVHNSEAVFLDTSSTALALAHHLTNHLELTVLTNSLAITEALLPHRNINLILIGGVLQRETLSLVDDPDLSLLEHYNIQTGFFGAAGISHPEGLTDINPAIAGVKRRILKRCRRVVGILDKTKWGKSGLATFAHFDEVHILITDQKKSTPLHPILGKHQIELITTKPTP